MKQAIKKLARGLCLVVLSLCLVTPLAIAASEGSLGGGDGSSFESAVVVPFTGDYFESVGQEYAYLHQTFGPEGKDWEMVSQRLVKENGRDYDVLEIKWIQSGEEQAVYFDITDLIENSPF